MSPLRESLSCPGLLLILGLLLLLSGWCRAFAQECITQVDVNASGTRKKEEIIELLLKVTTQDTRGSGTDNAVYFDIGAVSWRLNNRNHNDFERGRADIYKLDVDGLKLTTDDLLWLRLHKKGFIGFTGTKDGLTGAWHPEKIELIVNGSPYCETTVDEPLNSNCWFWKHPCRVIPQNDVFTFARALRLQRNEPLSLIDELSGFITTPLLKKQGVSGWLHCADERQCLDGVRLNSCPGKPWMVCAMGTVFEEPSDSTDGLATIDLKVEAVDFCNKQRLCDRANLKMVDPDRPRYLRVEYKHRRERIPRKGERVKFCGELLWDTDDEGWWEIHPRDSYDVGVISQK